MEPQAQCPVCSTSLQAPLLPATGDVFEYECQRCGRFGLSGSARVELQTRRSSNQKLGFIVSRAIRQMQRVDPRPLVDHSLVERLNRGGRLPSPIEQAENLISWVSDNLPGPGE